MLRALSCSGLMAWLLLILAPLLVPPDQIVRLTPQVSEESSWSPDGRRLVCDSNRAGKTTSLFVMDADGGNVAQLTRGPGSDETPAWSPDGKRFAYVSDRSGHAEIWLVDADGKNPRQLTRHGGEAIHPHWSPDGRRVIYCAGREKPEQYEIADGTGPQQLVELPGRCTSPKWSPDGKWISFDRALERSCEILRVPAPPTPAPAFPGPTQG